MCNVNTTAAFLEAAVPVVTDIWRPELAAPSQPCRLSHGTSCHHLPLLDCLGKFPHSPRLASLYWRQVFLCGHGQKKTQVFNSPFYLRLNFSSIPNLIWHLCESKIKWKPTQSIEDSNGYEQFIDPTTGMISDHLKSTDIVKDDQSNEESPRLGSCRHIDQSKGRVSVAGAGL